MPETKTVTPDQALSRIEPGMNIFLGTGAAEPRTLVKRLMASDALNLQDLTLIQLVSFGDAVSLEELRSNKYRLKTFFSGWVANEAIATGRVDLIPSRFSTIPGLIKNHQLPLDAAMIQITPPDENGLCSLGIAVDVGRRVMEQASLVIGEINPEVPRTYGDTFVSVEEFDLLVESDHPVPLFPAWPVDDVFDRVAANVASVVEDGSCLGFSFGPLFEALPRHLTGKKGSGNSLTLCHRRCHEPDQKRCGLQSPQNDLPRQVAHLLCHGLAGTDALAGPQSAGGIPEHRKRYQSHGDRQKLPFSWLFFRPARWISPGKSPCMPAKARSPRARARPWIFSTGLKSPGAAIPFSPCPVATAKGRSNIRISIEEMPNQLNMPDSVDMIATEYGIATLSGRTLRERAQALIEIAHPDDRPGLVDAAKAEKILYPDQIFLAESAHLYPSEISERHTFKNDTTVRFRALKPSDEEEMRRLFYRFSDEAIYYRYFTPIKTMPHAKMQSYVNVDYRDVLSVVGLVGPPGQGRIIAEARFARHKDKPYVDVAFVVDADYQGLGIATYLFRMLARLARQRGARGMTADVLATNHAMLKVFEKSGLH